MFRAAEPFLGEGNYLTDRSVVVANRNGELTPGQQQALSGALSSTFGRAVRLVTLSILPGICIGGTLLLAFLQLPLEVIFAFFTLLLIATVAVITSGLVLLTRDTRQLQRDLDDSKVVSGEGHLSYGSDGFTAEVDGRQLPLPFGRGGLVPGSRYRFYYLPVSGVVLSAETVEEGDPKQKVAGLQEILAKANNFGQEDLEANKAGRMSSQQVSRLVPQLLSGSSIILAALLIEALSLFLFSPLGRADQVTFLAFCGTLIAIPIFIVGLVRFWRALSDILGGKIAMEEGVGRKVTLSHGSRRDLEKRTGRETTTRFYQIDQKRIRVPERAYRALINSVPYRVYYAPNTKILMSIEPIGQPTE